MTARQTAAADLLRRYPRAPLRTLAHRAFRDNPRLWPTLNAARVTLQYLVGHNGTKSRSESAQKHLQRDLPPPPLDDFPTLPQPVARVWTWTPRVIPGPLRTLILSDIHIPYHDLSAIRAALNYGKAHAAECILLNGDIGDHSAVGFWPVDPRDKDYATERERIIEFLTTLRASFPRARIIYKIGNHDERYFRYLLRNAPELLALDCFDFASVFQLDKHGIELVESQDVIRLGRLTVIHGHEYRFAISNPVNPARGLFLKAKAHALCGHFHTSTKHSERTIDDHSIATWSTGCLCELHPQFRSLNNWEHGFAFVETDSSGGFEVANRSIKAGKVY